MSKKTLGWALVIIGLFMLFKMVRVSSFGFYRFGRMSTSAIVLVLLLLSAIAVVVNKNKFTVGCFIFSLALLVISLIMGTELYFAYVSLTDNRAHTSKCISQKKRSILIVLKIT